MIRSDLKSLRKHYKEAKEGIDGAITNFKIKIKSWIDEANTKKTNYNKRFRGKTVDEIWADIQEEKIKVIVSLAVDKFLTSCSLKLCLIFQFVVILKNLSLLFR